MIDLGPWLDEGPQVHWPRQVATVYVSGQPVAYLTRLTYAEHVSAYLISGKPVFNRSAPEPRTSMDWLRAATFDNVQSALEEISRVLDDRRR